MKHIKKFWLVTLIFLGTGCDTGTSVQDESVHFITLLGADTLAAETFQVHERSVEARVMLRTPETSLQHYVLKQNDSGAMLSLSASYYDPLDPDGPPVRSQEVTVEGDSVIIVQTSEEGTTRRSALYEEGTLPFLDMIHWPYELALKTAYSAETQPYVQPLLAGSRIMPFEISRLSADSMSIKHPFRGTMGVRVNEMGQLLTLNAAGTTRKVLVSRVETLDLTALATRYGQMDEAGKPFGDLSTRGETLATISGVDFRVDYGRPAKRGRAIYGSLVPYGEIWRTGANRATHLEISGDIMLDGLSVPAGTYTLYSIPESDGGLLIVNKQTGQGGTTYNQDQDLGRVAMRVNSTPELVEQFTIAIEQTQTGGVLKLLWDTTSLEIPFEING